MIPGKTNPAAYLWSLKGGIMLAKVAFSTNPVLSYNSFITTITILICNSNSY